LARRCHAKKKDAPPKIENVDFDKGFSISSEFVDATSQFEIMIHLNDSMHAYAPGEKIGKAIKLEITDQNGWSAEGPVVIPNGKKKKLGELGESIVLEGDINLRQKLKRGSGKGEALLHLQVCANSICDRPRVHRLPIVSGRP
jgi:hypothetical protein